MTEAAAASCCSTAPRRTAGIGSEGELRELLEAGSLAGEDLVELLDEAHPLYDGMRGPVVVRVRGALLLALADQALGPDALPFVLEELESAHDAYLTAVAAHVLRTASAPDPAFVQPLLSALLYIRHRDDSVCLDAHGGQAGSGNRTTAMAEVLRTLAWLGADGREALPRLRQLRAEKPGPRTIARLDETVAAIEASSVEEESPLASRSCCCGSQAAADEPGPPSPEDLAGVEFQDQKGRRFRFEEFFVGKPTVVVFFYTRCENPTKCPLTVSKLGSLQRRLREEGLDSSIRTAAITYDPEFDLPARLEQFGRSWGAETGPDHRLLRTLGDFAPVRNWFELGVNYTASVVNRHRLEAYVLDAEGRIDARITRRRWREEELLSRARTLIR